MISWFRQFSKYWFVEFVSSEYVFANIAASALAVASLSELALPGE